MANNKNEKPAEKYKCKITVMKKLFHEDLYKDYPSNIEGSCARLEVGQEFICDSEWDPPEGFCTWAWADIRSMIHNVYSGNPNPIITSWTDGLRPVIFKVERIDASTGI